MLICDGDGGIINDPVDDADGREHVLVRARLVRRAALRAGLRNAYAEPRRNAARGGRGADADPGPQVEGPDARPVRRRDRSTCKYYFFMRTELAASRSMVTRTGWTSEVGYELYLLDRTRGQELWEAVMEAGAPYNVRPTGPVRHPPHRRRHLQLGRRHDLREQPARDGPRTAGRLGTARLGGHSPCRRCAGSGRGCAPAHRRRRNGRRAFPALNYIKWPVYAKASGGSRSAR